MLDVICLTINHSSCNESTFIIFFVHIKVAAAKFIRKELKSVVFSKYLWVNVDAEKLQYYSYSLIEQN